MGSFVEQRPNGDVVPSGRYGPNVAGVIVYDQSGAMMAPLMNPDRPRFAATNATRGTPEEVKAAFDGYNAYDGTYSIDVATATIQHRVEGNLFRNLARIFHEGRDAVARETRMQVAAARRSADSAGYRPRTPLQDAPIFHRQCARSLKTEK